MLRMVFFLKPDAVVRRYVGARTVKDIISINGVKPLTFLELMVDRSFLEEKHYAEHKGKHFFDWLVRYNTLTPIILMILEIESEYVINKIRRVLGPTLVHKAIEQDPGSLRGRYGVYGGANVAHASDSAESARREYEFWYEYITGLNYKLDENEAIRSAKEYIRKYIDFPIVDNRRYIEEIEAFLKGEKTRDEVKRKLIKFLMMETDEEFKNNPQIIENLAEEILNNAEL